MKKILLSLLFVVIIFAGCEWGDNVFALKEKCAKYKRKQELHKFYQGTFYSRAKQTCISKILDTENDTTIHYIDEFTGTVSLFSLPSQSDEQMNYEKELDLIK